MFYLDANLNVSSYCKIIKLSSEDCPTSESYLRRLKSLYSNSWMLVVKFGGNLKKKYFEQFTAYKRPLMALYLYIHNSKIFLSISK